MSLEKPKFVYIVDGTRTPFMKAKYTPSPFSSGDLAVYAGKALLMRQKFSPEEINEVIVGCALSSPEEANIARVIALRLGCDITTPAWTVQRNCGSGLQALDSAIQSIQLGRSDLILAGGTEVMSRAPLLYSKPLMNWLGQWKSSKTRLSRLKTITHFRGSFLVPEVALVKGLTDPTVGLNMGETAEELAFEFKITREQMDAYALESHQRLALAYNEKKLEEEITPLVDSISGKVYVEDDGLRRNSTLENLAKLPSFFDKKYGKVTAGNSSQITDGACLLLLASEKAVKQLDLPVLGRISPVEWVGVSPVRMGVGPVYAIANLLNKYKMTLDNMDAYEINEAFAAQILACSALWERDYASTLGSLSLQKLNQEGGAISLGHPVGASGARIVLHLLHRLKQQNEKKGVAALCIGGGQGGAVLLER
jgi:acetyl-CoA C-acetyltransferase